MSDFWYSVLINSIISVMALLIILLLFYYHHQQRAIKVKWEAHTQITHCTCKTALPSKRQRHKQGLFSPTRVLKVYTEPCRVCSKTNTWKA